MQPFVYQRPETLRDAMVAAARNGAMLVAGGTEIVNWMKEGIVAPVTLIDIGHLRGLDDIVQRNDALRLGGLARMSDVAAHPDVRRNFPAIAEALSKSASAQIRNAGTMGGNLMQRTRCPYFRADVPLPCNAREVSSGCSALTGEDRSMALFGWNESCIATHPSDVAVALAALDAIIEVQSASGTRSIAIADFYRSPATAGPLSPGDIVTAINVPASPLARHSHYLKLRERASYEFALVSAAAAVSMNGERIGEARIAIGGVAHKPWRLAEAEDALRGARLDDKPALHAAIARSFADARPRRRNGFKVELGIRAAIRAIQRAGGAA